MKIRIRLYILYFFISFALFINYSTASELKLDTISPKLVTKIDKVMYKYSIPGAAVLVYKDGKMYQYVFGVMNIKSGEPVTSKTIFELGSVTKSFTGLLLAEQISTGKMHLDDRLLNYLNNKQSMSNSIKKITLLELATHTASLPYNAMLLVYHIMHP